MAQQRRVENGVVLCPKWLTPPMDRTDSIWPRTGHIIEATYYGDSTLGRSLMSEIALLALVNFNSSLLTQTSFRSRSGWAWRPRCSSATWKTSLKHYRKFNMYTVSQKTIPPNHHNNFNSSCPIPVIFGTYIPERICHRKMVYCPTSPA